MDEVPDWRKDEVTRTDLPPARPEPASPPTGQVRIIGAEPAGEVTGELPKVTSRDDPDGDDDGEDERGGPVPDDDELEQSAVRLTDQPAAPGAAGPTVHPVSPGQTAVPSGTPTELPHWTEPPTGQVPAVLSRRTGEEGSGIEGPSWREEDADWVAHEELFEPAMFGDDEVALGSLDETDRGDLERRPWEFDLDSGPTPKVRAQPDEVRGAENVRVVGNEGGGADTVHPITEPVEVVADATSATHGGGPVHGGGLVHGGEHGSDADRGAGTSQEIGTERTERTEGQPDRSDRTDAVPIPIDDEEQETGVPAPGPSLPTGTERIGRSRRSSLLPTRLRAKRPEALEDAAVPLAAQPPGASVTEVPGAGRKKRDVAGLAAADRTAGQQSEAAASDAPGDGPPPASADIAPAAGLRRGGRRTSVRPASAGVPLAVATGGGPPSPDRASPSRRGGGTSSIGLRLGTGAVVALVALLAFKLGTVVSLVLVVIVVTFAAGECFGVLRRAGYHPATLLGLAGTISLTVGAYSKGIAALPLVLVLITVFTLVWYLLGIERGSPVAGTAATLLAVGWVSLLGSYAGLLLSPSTFPNRHGIAFLLGAIIATVANDIGALAVGGWMGRTPLAPSISPNKTWEGLLGGAVFTILISTVVVGSIHPWSASNAALLGVVVAVIAPIGDLCESMFKRDLRLKDMGSLLPGHGGVLDRVDALLFVLPATYYLVRALNIA